MPAHRPECDSCRHSVKGTRHALRGVQIVRGEYPMKPGLILGHEPVGVIDERLLVRAELFHIFRTFLQHDRAFSLHLPTNELHDIGVSQGCDVARVHRIR